MATPYPHDSNCDESRRLAGANFTCVLCSQRFNEADCRLQDDIESLRVCPFCFEENGGSLRREEMRAEGADLAAELNAKELEPPKYPGWKEDDAVVVIYDFSVRPRTLVRGGAAATLILTGNGFASGDTLVYGDANITNASAPVITSTTVTLSVQAGGSAALGFHELVYNGVSYKRVFEVRTA